jgi:hypothetical protein
MLPALCTIQLRATQADADNFIASSGRLGAFPEKSLISLDIDLWRFSYFSEIIDCIFLVYGLSFQEL